jgi:hypothetical protein
MCIGGDETLSTVDADSRVGWYPSVAIDDEGNPVIAYAEGFDTTGRRIRLAECNDPACTGGDEAIHVLPLALHPSRDGPSPSLVLSATGDAIIAYTGGPGIVTVDLQ